VLDYRFLPHTEKEVNEMLQKIGVEKINDLYADVPQIFEGELNIPETESEMDLRRDLYELSETNKNICDNGIFRGAGIYQHYIPSAVYQIASKRGFLTAYTPYQAEVSQGTLQMMFEFQTMICEITGMEVANSSMYDGATATAEAALMAARVTKKDKTIIAESVHPEYIETTKTYLEPQNLTLQTTEIDKVTGRINLESLKEKIDENTNSVIVGYPNFFGIIEDLKSIREIISEKIMLIVVVNPIALGLLEAPGNLGADIVVGEGQPLGSYPSLGGPGFGLFASKKKYIRNMPGRIIGETVDEEGKRAFAMVLQTREQHIRRGKATSNICSNQAFNALLATIHTSLLGKRGFKQVALQNYHKAHYLADKLMKTEKFEPVFEGPFFNEFVLKSKISIDEINKKLLEEKYFGPLNLKRFFKEMDNHALFCATELNRKEDIDFLVSFLEALIWN